MFHTGRCGSTVLAGMLNDHSRIYWHGETFQQFVKNKKNKEKEKLVEQVLDWSCHREISRIYGFETKYLPQQHLSQECIDLNLEDYLVLLSGQTC